MGRKRKSETDKLTGIICEAIRDKKGNDIVVLNLTRLSNPICRSFIICHADSGTQVNAIANSVEHEIKSLTGEKVWKKEGFENANWIILDYVDVVVHIFQTSFREYYCLEKMWADAEITKVL